MLRFTTGSFPTSPLARKLVEVEFSTDIQFAIKFSKESWKIKIVGRMPRTNVRRKLVDLVIARSVLLIGGLDLGSLAL